MALLGMMGLLSRKVSERSLGWDRMLCQTSHKLLLFVRVPQENASAVFSHLDHRKEYSEGKVACAKENSMGTKFLKSTGLL